MQIMKLLIMYFTVVPITYSHPGPNILHNTLFSNISGLIWRIEFNAHIKQYSKTRSLI
jgi:hypothetical protein